MIRKTPTNLNTGLLSGCTISASPPEEQHDPSSAEENASFAHVLHVPFAQQSFSQGHFSLIYI
jgi:hypothetical protein